MNLPLPPKALSPNARVHWGAKARATADYRGACGVAFARVARRAGWPSQQCVDLEVEYRCPKGAVGYIARDTQNAMAATKAAVDAMQDAEIILSDAKGNLAWRGFTLLTTKRECGGKEPGVTFIVRARWP